MTRSTARAEDVINALRAQANPHNVAGMARFGINVHNAFGVSTPAMRKLAASIKKDHALALQLWQTGIHEGRVVATMIDDPNLVTRQQMESWVRDFDSWDVCDQACMGLFSRISLGIEKAHEWSLRQEEFVKRAGFALMASLALGKKDVSEEQLAAFLPDIEREAGDERNFVKKAVNWALRQIGKKDLSLNKLAVETAVRIRKQDTKSARWIAADALRELTGEPVRSRLNKKSS
jgi:3-methyladenine DNA glycosylase AlkD